MVYPDEEAALMASAVPLAFRVAYGFLARMGFRKSEAVGTDPGDDEPAPPMTWDRLDLERGGLRGSFEDGEAAPHRALA